MYLPFSSCDEVVGELAARTPAGTAPLWLLCVADRHGDDLPALLAALAVRGLRVCGALFPGLIHGDRSFDRGIVALQLPDNTRLASIDLSDGVRWRESPPELDGAIPSSLVVMVDCQSPGTALLLEELYDRYGHRATHFGAGAGWHDLRQSPAIFTPQGLRPKSALLLMLPHATTVQVRHGWHRLGGPFIATRTNGNVIQEINWETAGGYYRRRVAEASGRSVSREVFAELNMTYPLCIGREGSEDVLRDPMRITDADELVVLSDVPENSVMYLAHADHDALIDATREAVQACDVQALVRHCFVVDCYSRALSLGERFAEELQVVRQAVARITDAVPEGVLALGEIAAPVHQPLEFYNKTFVVALVE